MGFADCMKQGIAGKLTDKQNSYLADILNASKTLETLINDILDLALIEAGHDRARPHATSRSATCWPASGRWSKNGRARRGSRSSAKAACGHRRTLRRSEAAAADRLQPRHQRDRAHAAERPHRLRRGRCGGRSARLRQRHRRRHSVRVSAGRLRALREHDAREGCAARGPRPRARALVRRTARRLGRTRLAPSAKARASPATSRAMPFKAALQAWPLTRSRPVRRARKPVRIRATHAIRSRKTARPFMPPLRGKLPVRRRCVRDRG